MTPEEIAQKLADKWYMGAPYMYDEYAPQVVADIAEAIRDAYERAAHVAEKRIDDALVVGYIIDEIRALKGDDHP